MDFKLYAPALQGVQKYLLGNNESLLTGFAQADMASKCEIAPIEDMTPAGLVLGWLAKFFQQQRNFDLLHTLLHKQKGRSKDVPSLRVLEHLVTSFSKEKSFDFKLPHADIPMHLYDAYQAELQRHGKILFDVFAREDKQGNIRHVLTSPDEDGRTISTTAKQMNFVRWAIVNNVLDYAILHLQSIKDHLPTSSNAAKVNKNDDLRRKRQRASFNCPSKLHKGNFKLSFNLPERDL